MVAWLTSMKAVANEKYRRVMMQNEMANLAEYLDS